MPTQLSAGGEIDCWCTKCKMDLGHRIVAMVGAAPKRVLCQTCGSEHNYRAPKTDATKPVRRTTKAAGTKKPAAPRGAAAAKADWESMVKSGKPFKRYMITETFSEGDLVQHKKFGEGYIKSVLGDGKVSVAFSGGEKTLLHAQKG